MLLQVLLLVPTLPRWNDYSDAPRPQDSRRAAKKIEIRRRSVETRINKAFILLLLQVYTINMNHFDNNISDLFKRTKPALTPRESEFLRQGMWRRFRHRRNAVRVQFILATAIVLAMAAAITMRTPANKQLPDIDAAMLTYNELVSETQNIPSDRLISEVLGDDASNMEDAVFSQSDVEDVYTALSSAEQQEILLAMGD